MAPCDLAKGFAFSNCGCCGTAIYCCMLLFNVVYVFFKAAFYSWREKMFAVVFVLIICCFRLRTPWPDEATSTKVEGNGSGIKSVASLLFKGEDPLPHLQFG